METNGLSRNEVSSGLTNLRVHEEVLWNPTSL